MATNNPTFVGSAENQTSSSGATSLAVTYASSAGNVLLVGVVLNNGTQTVSAISDSTSSYVSPLTPNAWVLLDAITFGSQRLEVWACISPLPITSVTVAVTGTQKITAAVVEWSHVTNFNIIGHNTVNAPQNPDATKNIKLQLTEIPPTRNCTALSFFAGGAAFLTPPTGDGTLRFATANSSPVPNLAFVDQASVDDLNRLVCGMQVNQLATPTNLANSNLTGVIVLASGGFQLTTPPGFSDVPDASFQAEAQAYGTLLSKLADNCSFGTSRLEVFQGLYTHGQTVTGPVSPIDGYVYSQTELMYSWAVKSTVNPSTDWITGPDSLFYCNWFVDQTTGLVTCEEWYRRSGSNANITKSNDGKLLVFTIAQRQNNALLMAVPPYYILQEDTAYAGDDACNQTLMQDLSRSAKFAAADVEIIYMGEFITGTTVPRPVSPIDGTAFEYDQVSFMSCWKWTTSGSNYIQPPLSWGQLGPMTASIDAATGAVSLNVKSINSGLVSNTSYGRVSVFAVCRRTLLPSNGKMFGTADSNGLPPGWSFHPNSQSTHANLVMSYDENNPFTAAHALEMVLGSAGLHAGIISKPFRVYAGEVYSLSAYLKADVSAGWPFLQLVMFDASGSFAFANITDELPGTITTNGNSTNAWVKCTASVTIPNDGSTWAVFSIKSNTNSATQWARDCQIVRTSGPVRYAQDVFTEVDPTEFFPGNPLPYNSLQQLDINARQAALTPEMFGPTTYKDGDYVTLPTSPVDGYTYSRAECVYFWDWTDTTNQTGSNLRVPLFHGQIDQSTGLVSLVVWRLADGGPTLDDNNTLCRIKVTVLAFRATSNSPSTDNGVNPPSDAGTSIADLPANGFLVNGS